MTVEMNKDMIRLLVIDVSGVYSNIHDEMYIPAYKESEVIKSYSNGYTVVKVS